MRVARRVLRKGVAVAAWVERIRVPVVSALRRRLAPRIVVAVVHRVRCPQVAGDPLQAVAHLHILVAVEFRARVEVVTHVEIVVHTGGEGRRSGLISEHVAAVADGGDGRAIGNVLRRDKGIVPYVREFVRPDGGAAAHAREVRQIGCVGGVIAVNAGAS